MNFSTFQSSNVDLVNKKSTFFGNFQKSKKYAKKVVNFRKNRKKSLKKNNFSPEKWEKSKKKSLKKSVAGEFFRKKKLY